MSKLRYYITLKQKKSKKIFFEQKPKNPILGGQGLKKPKRTLNIVKLGNYLPFEQKK